MLFQNVDSRLPWQLSAEMIQECTTVNNVHLNISATANLRVIHVPWILQLEIHGNVPVIVTCSLLSNTHQTDVVTNACPAWSNKLSHSSPPAGAVWVLQPHSLDIIGPSQYHLPINTGSVYGFLIQ